MKTLTKEMQSKLSPKECIQLLKEGNKRFVNSSKANRNLLEQVSETSKGQYPYAIILSCIDSRTSSELIFDQGMGDIFNCRIAGNIVNEDILGSMEFACKVAGSKLIVVLGHSKCGAVKGACDNVKLGNLSVLLSKVKPAIDAEKSTKEERNASNAQFVENVAELNVHLTMKEIPRKSDILADMIRNNEIALVGGMYDVETGEVEFYEEDMITSQNLEKEVPELSNNKS